MRRLFDVLRLTFVSPELLAIFAALALSFFAKDVVQFLADLFTNDSKTALAAAFAPAIPLIGCYKVGTKVLAPKGKHKLLLEWPDYPMFKSRIIAACAWCMLALIATVIGVIYCMMHKGSSLGATLVIAGLFVSATCTVSVHLAQWNFKEILKE